MSGAPHRRASARDDVVDAVGAIALVLIGLVGFRHAFGSTEYMVVGAIAAVLGAGLAVLIVRLRFPAMFGLALSLVVFLAFGAAVAIRDQTAVHVLPTPAGVGGLVDGLVNGWRRLLTTLPPSGSFGNLLAIPFTLGFVPVLVCTLAARATRALGLLVVLPGVVLGLSVLFGERTPFSLLVQGAVFAGVAIGWLALRRARERRIFLQLSGGKRWISGLIMLGLIGAGGFFAGPHLPLASAQRREVLDRDSPPFDPRQYPSPLNGYDRYLNGDLKDATLFTVSGLPDNKEDGFTRLRLATMDDYNGVVWEVDPLAGSRAYEFLRVGESVPTTAVGAPIAVSVAVDKLATIWVPDAGVVTGITWQTPGERAKQQRNVYRLSTYTQTGAAPLGRGLTTGDAYTVRAVVTAEPNDDALAGQHIDPSLRSKVNGIVPDVLAAKAGEIAKAKTSPAEELRALDDWFLSNGYYTEGDTGAGQSPLQPGHSAARLAAFLATDNPVGSSEQFASAMALMARTLGIPARVVMGFRVDNGAGVAVPVQGHQVDAWVEVPFTDSRGVTTWVTYDPTPRDRKQQPPDVPQKSKRPVFQSQDVPPPPLSPPPPDVVDVQSGKANPSPAPQKPPERKPQPPADHTALIAGSIAGGVPVALWVLFASTVLLLKRRRRRARRRRGAASGRMSGGWDEYVDVARDIGHPVPARATRREAALLIGTTESAQLAAAADEAVFGGSDPTADDIAGYWDDVATARSELRSPLSPWRKLRASLSLTSLRSRR